MTSAQTMSLDTPSQAGYVFHVISGLMAICGGFGSQDTSQRAKASVQQAVFRVEKMWKTLKAIMQEITAAETTMLYIGAGTDYNTATMDVMYIDARRELLVPLPPSLSTFPRSAQARKKKYPASAQSQEP
jgi:hypothetical protein